MARTYTTDDLIKMTNLGYFGSHEMNILARSAFINLKRLEVDNLRLKNLIESQEIQIFQVNSHPNDSVKQQEKPPIKTQAKSQEKK